MTLDLARRGVHAVLLDIEGTTTPIAFVHDVLFTFARARLDVYLDSRTGSPELVEVERQLTAEYAEDAVRGDAPQPWSTAAYARWLMDRDRKSPGLKRLQGQIWEEGYRAGALRGEVYDDVPRAMRRWRAAGVDVAIYSSGSELAQRRLFGSTVHGDLTPLVTGFFDTAAGAKVEPASYARIAGVLGRLPREVLFVSDVVAELVAARGAGMGVALSVRPGNPPQPAAGEFEIVATLDQVV